MSENKLTLIGETSGFMVNSVKNGLVKAGYEVISVAPELTAISRLPEKTGIWLIYLDGKMLRIWKSRVCTADEESRCSSGQPGTVASSENGRLIVRTGEGLLEITELQLEGKKRMPAADFLRGKAVSEGTVLG